MRGRAIFFALSEIFAEIFVSNEEKVLYLQCNKEQTRRAAQLYNHCTEIMTTLKDLIGKTIVGYRYGEAPKDGRSYNYRDKNYECGVSMASVGYYKEIGSFAVSEANQSRRKYYYIGDIIGTGGDDEICLSNVRRITYKDYLSMRKNQVDISNMVVNYYCDRLIDLLNRGFSIGRNEDEIEAIREQYTK